MAAQSDIDAANAGFWDELCGTNLAREVGIVDASPASLERFDRAYLDLYPYLEGYIRAPDWAGRRVLEVGLGYGTVSEGLARSGADYHGVDIAPGPVGMVRARLERIGGARPEQVQQASVHDLPFPDASFDRVVSIGCLHHTGDLSRGIAEVRRVLRPGGELLLMATTAAPRGASCWGRCWPHATGWWQARRRRRSGCATPTTGTAAATRRRTRTSWRSPSCAACCTACATSASTAAASTACRSGRSSSRARG